MAYLVLSCQRVMELNLRRESLSRTKNAIKPRAQGKFRRPRKRDEMLPHIALNTFRFAEPLYLWLLAVPGVLLAMWIWQIRRRRFDAEQWKRERMVPIAERFRLAGDLAFWICLIFASSLCIAALARPEA